MTAEKPISNKLEQRYTCIGSTALSLAGETRNSNFQRAILEIGLENVGYK
jgi:hypothetical protein